MCLGGARRRWPVTTGRSPLLPPTHVSSTSWTNYAAGATSPRSSAFASSRKAAPWSGKRDDLTIEYATLLNVVGRHDEALAVIRSRRFHPWEGGEGLVSGQWVLANLRLGALALDAGDPGTAIGFGEAALTRPPNLGEGKDILAPENEVQCHLGLALRAAGRESEARRWLDLAATVQGVAQAAEGEPTYWQAQARRRPR